MSATPVDTDLPPLTKFLVAVHMLNTVLGRTVNHAARTGHLTFWYAVIVVVLWTWAVLVVLPELQQWLHI